MPLGTVKPQCHMQDRCILRPGWPSTQPACPSQLAFPSLSEAEEGDPSSSSEAGNGGWHCGAECQNQARGSLWKGHCGVCEALEEEEGVRKGEQTDGAVRICSFLESGQSVGVGRSAVALSGLAVSCQTQDLESGLQ